MSQSTYDYPGLFVTSTLLSIHNQHQQPTKEPHFPLGPNSRIPDERLRKFLDKLAEIFPFSANDDNALHVSAAALVWHGSARIPKVYVTKNQGCRRSDFELAAALARWIQDVGGWSGNLTEDGMEQLREGWLQHLGYLSTNISQRSIDRIRKADDADFQAIYESSDLDIESAQALKELSKLSENTTLYEQHKLLFAAYTLRHAKLGFELSKTQKAIKKAIDLLGRHWSAYSTVKSVAQLGVSAGIPFHDFEIICLPLMRRDQVHQWHGVERALSACMSQFRALQYEQECRAKLHNHARFCDTIVHCHAEIQLLGYMESKLPRDEEPYSYFGVSKLSCWLCYQLLSFYGSRRYSFDGYHTGGCYGSVYHLWDVCVLRSFEVDHLHACLDKMLAVIALQLKSPRFENRRAIAHLRWSSS